MKNFVCAFFLLSSENRAKYQIRTWNAAKKIVGLPPSSLNMISRNNFFEKTAVDVIGCAQGASFHYKEVWKAGNNFFRENMYRYCHATDNPLSLGYGSDPFTFSFVRDSFSHFESAYREVAGRILIYYCVNKPNRHRVEQTNLTCKDVANPSKAEFVAEQLLLDFLKGNKLTYYYDHFSLMSAFLFSKKPYPSFIGRLETIEKDWNHMCSVTSKCPSTLDDYSKLSKELGQHPITSHDKFGHGAGFRRLLQKKPEWALAIRKLVELDDICLPPAMKF